MKNEILVSVCCLTYNHELYIRECLESLVSQKTNFKYEVIVHDDASTDSTQNIIKEYEKKYPEIIKPIYQKVNQHSQKIKIGMTHIYPRAKGKYIAYCEGDDSWSDKYKLQKQVDILESKPDVGAVYTGFNTIDTSSNPVKMEDYDNMQENSYSGDLFAKLLRANFILTVTVCCRKELLTNEIYFNSPTSLDYLLFLVIAWNSDFVYLKDKTANYRINPKGMVRSNNKALEKRLDSVFFYISDLYLKGTFKRKRSLLTKRKILKSIHRRYQRFEKQGIVIEKWKKNIAKCYVTLTSTYLAHKYLKKKKGH